MADDDLVIHLGEDSHAMVVAENGVPRLVIATDERRLVLTPGELITGRANLSPSAVVGPMIVAREAQTWLRQLQHLADSNAAARERFGGS